jgi:methylated-DNA-[protein]-cysteine S-methyltransferase
MNLKNIPHGPSTFIQVLPGTPLGPITLFFSDAGLAALVFGEEEAGSGPRVLPGAPASRSQEVLQELAGYFAGTPTDFSSLSLDLKGTPFQLRVWQELRRIPWGTTISYRELAARAGSPQGFRAAGQAVGANPIPLIIPCHRVIAADGSLGGYSSGLHRKRWLLEHENALQQVVEKIIFP